MSFFENSLRRLKNLARPESVAKTKHEVVAGVLQSTPARDGEEPIEKNNVQNIKFGTFGEPGIENGEKESTFRPIASRSMVALVEGNKDRPNPEVSADFIAHVLDQISMKFNQAERPFTPKDQMGKVIEDHPDRNKNAKAKFRQLFAEMYEEIDRKKIAGFSALSVARIVTFEDVDYIVTATVGNVPIFVVRTDGSMERISTEDLDQTHSIGANLKSRDPRINAIKLPENTNGILIASTTFLKNSGSLEQLGKSIKNSIQKGSLDAEEVAKQAVIDATNEAQRQRPNAKSRDEYSATFLRIAKSEQTVGQLKLSSNLESRFTPENMVTLTRLFQTLTALRDEDPVNNTVATEILGKIRPIVLEIDSPNSDVQRKIRGLVIRNGYTRESIQDKVSKLFELDSLPEEYKLKETIIGLLTDKVADIWGLTL